MNLDHSRSPTQSCIHTSTHTIYVTLLIAPLLLPPQLNSPICNVCTQWESTHIHLQMSYLHHCGRQSWVTELSRSHRHQPLSKGSWSLQKYGPDENGKKHMGVSVMMTVGEAVVMFRDVAISRYPPPTHTEQWTKCASEQISRLCYKTTFHQL